jgi:hypothetical protein
MPNIGLWELLIILVVLGGFVLWIVALVDAIRVPDDSMYRSGNKTVWVLVIALTGFIGAIIYYAAGRPGRDVPRPKAAPQTWPQGALAVDYRGVRYALGRISEGYAIWDTAAGGTVIRTFPLTQDGWDQAWKAYYEELEGAPPTPPRPRA